MYARRARALLCHRHILFGLSLARCGNMPDMKTRSSKSSTGDSKIVQSRVRQFRNAKEVFIEAVHHLTVFYLACISSQYKLAFIYTNDILTQLKNQ